MLVDSDRSHRGEHPSSVGNEHAFVVDELGLLRSELPSGVYFRIHGPVELPPRSCPEPDITIVRGKPFDFRRQHPSATAISCAIEVADSSLRIDRTTKLRLYADAGIPQYVLINLVDRVIESHRQPVIGEGRYAVADRLRAGQVLTLVLPGGATLDVPVERFIADRQP